ncbi:TetR/AcrR family transcriptional regulator [Actinoplanes sp. TFC3]|uniref:TetR/AcrR family transcriptional regulator n=1 Tax=Actinoplanes sp. TFC3 TaxID=1710355 RepID=UPI0008335306|nr:TetR/AcrR family transcriptional regulator [Actinoplanes sp. TFC3]
MTTQARRRREQADREKLIIKAARDLAEAEGWDAVTTRRLAAEIEYSQPVLYSHFKGKDAIMAAVATEGFTDLAAELHTARTSAPEARLALTAVGAAYAAFADRRPAVYDAMFTHAVDLTFASPETPAILQAGFTELLETVRPLAGDDDVAALAETFWSGLHGLVTLMRNGRLRREDHDKRLAILFGRFAA